MQEAAFSFFGGGSKTANSASSESLPLGSVEDCLRKVREAESSLQLAREALEHRESTESQANDNNRESAFQGLTLQKDATPRIHAKDRARCRQMFESIDKDKSGKVSILELRALLDKVGSEPVTDAEYDDLKLKLQLHDANADGFLDFDEFVRAFCYNKAQKDAELKMQMSKLQKDAAQNQQDQMPPEQYVQIVGVAPSAVTYYLRKELDETSACLQLPQAFLIFVFFFLSVTTHWKLDRLYAIDQAITWDINENANFAFSGMVPYENGRMGHKNIEDVNSIADFWSWFNMGLVPIFWPQGWDVNEIRNNAMMECINPDRNMALKWWGGFEGLHENVSEAQERAIYECASRYYGRVAFQQDTKDFFGGQGDFTGTYLLFHKIIGGVRLRQERTPLIDCKQGVEEMRGAAYKGHCVQTMDYWLKPELHNALIIDESFVNRPGGETYHLLSRKSQDEIRAELSGLENRAWFSPQTAKIELLFTTYNANEDLVTATYILFFLNRGGHIHKVVEPVSFYLDPYHGLWFCYAFDIAWAALCLKLLLEESWEILKHWRQLGLAKGCFIYTSIPNMVDWVSIGFTIFLVTFWLVHLRLLGDVKEMLTAADTSIQGSWANQSDRDAFFSLVDQCVQETHLLRFVLAIYPFVIVSRFFKAFSSQPRLAMVTKTLGKASTDIIHFGVVFGTVFIIFAFSAMILWGQELQDFANEMRSLQSVFRILLGDFDWELLHNIGRAQAYMWFWTFIWLVNLVMLNMLLAIIMDVYTDVKAGIGPGAETLWSQSIEIYKRTRDVYMGHSVALRKILSALDPTDLDDEDDKEDGSEEAEDEGEENLYVETLCQKVPKLKQDQAMQVLVESHKLKVSLDRSSDTLSDALTRIQKIDSRTLMIQDTLARLVQVNGADFQRRNKSSVVI